MRVGLTRGAFICVKWMENPRDTDPTIPALQVVQMPAVLVMGLVQIRAVILSAPKE